MQNKIQELNKVQILCYGDYQFRGEVIEKGRIVLQTATHRNKQNCMKVLNKKIKEYNLFYDKKIPLLIDPNNPLLFGESAKAQREQVRNAVAEKNANLKGEYSEQPTQEIQPEVEKSPEPTSPPKPRKPSRKPFTPYGLNGYLVDKQGNVRLMLDRRASAKTIVLDPTMFSALAEMVKKTQEQNND